MKVVAIIQARMNSTRLPGKVIKELCGKPILEHILFRVKKSQYINEIIVATSDNSMDNIIEDITLRNYMKIFRGDENNVLERFYLAAKENNVDIIIRLTADNPLIDMKIIDTAILAFTEKLHKSGIDYMKIGKGYPIGMGAEIFTFTALEKAYLYATKSYEKEHVTPYLYDINNNFKIEDYYSKDIHYGNYDEIRLTVDTELDFKLVNEIYSALYQGNNNFSLGDIIKLLKSNSELIEINKAIRQKTIQE